MRAQNEPRKLFCKFSAQSVVELNALRVAARFIPQHIRRNVMEIIISKLGDERVHHTAGPYDELVKSSARNVDDKTRGCVTSVAIEAHPTRYIKPPLFVLERILTRDGCGKSKAHVRARWEMAALPIDPSN